MKGGEAKADAARHYWPSFLRGDDANEIHSRLSGDGDPLRLRERTARRMREVWFLIEPDRIFARAAALCANAAKTEPAPADLEVWTLGKVDKAIEQLVHRDAEAEEREPALVSEEERLFPMLTESMMREPARVRAISVRFNALEPLARRAFFELLIEGRDVLEVIEGGPWNRESLRALILKGLAALDFRLPKDESNPSKEPQP